MRTVALKMWRSNLALPLVRDVKQLDLAGGLRQLNEFRGTHGYGFQLGEGRRLGDFEVA
jgi:hypothetical protein